MVDINITRMSSKGQIVIPSNMRKDLKEGEEFLIIKEGDRFILKSAENISNELKEDLEFARRTEEALKRIESGQCIQMGFDEFIEEMKTW